MCEAAGQCSEELLKFYWGEGDYSRNLCNIREMAYWILIGIMYNYKCRSFSKQLLHLSNVLKLAPTECSWLH